MNILDYWSRRYQQSTTKVQHIISEHNLIYILLLDFELVCKCLNNIIPFYHIEYVYNYSYLTV